MASWSSKRRSVYAVTVIGSLVLVIGIPAFMLLYKPPTCFDKIKNGDEQAVDCGGSCARLCPAAYIMPSIRWTRFAQSAPGLYNVAAYVTNPNPTVKGVVPYLITLYGKDAVPISEVRGEVTVPAGRDTLAFVPAIKAGIQKPIRATFEWTAYPEWTKSSDTLGMLSIEDKRYSETDAGSTLSVTLRNADTRPVRRLTVYAILLDKDGNALDFSKTIVDEVPGTDTTVAPFTWSTSHEGRVVSIEVLPVAE